jgi:hypothetical protein
MMSLDRSSFGTARDTPGALPVAGAAGTAPEEEVVLDPDRASSLLADVYSPNRL